MEEKRNQVWGKRVLVGKRSIFRGFLATVDDYPRFVPSCFTVDSVYHSRTYCFEIRELQNFADVTSITTQLQ